MGKIQVVAVDNCLNFYPDNILQKIFAFRHKMVRRLEWTQGLTLQKTSMAGSYSETDDQDKPGTVYFAKQDVDGEIVGVIRVSPSVDETGRPISMIRQAFNYLVDPDKSLPEQPDIWETSRILVDLERYTDRDERSQVVSELIASTFFYAHQKNIKGLFCFMAEGLWKSTYMRIGLEVERLGQNHVIKDKRDYNVFAGVMKIDDEIIARISKNTGLDSSLLDFGASPSHAYTHHYFENVNGHEVLRFS